MMLVYMYLSTGGLLVSVLSTISVSGLNKVLEGRGSEGMGQVKKK